jgi:flagellar hook assembly protein FlgD
MWIGTNGGISIFEPDTSTAVEDRTAHPSALAITGNRPNPFNPSTTISFTLPQPGRASLAVYDITGRKVRTLVSWNLRAGEHSVVWDGRHERGETVSSGVYIAQLRAGKTSANRRMVLVK